MHVTSLWGHICGCDHACLRPTGSNRCAIGQSVRDIHTCADSLCSCSCVSCVTAVHILKHETNHTSIHRIISFLSDEVCTRALGGVHVTVVLTRVNLHGAQVCDL
jgi:hypothetical protein